MMRSMSRRVKNFESAAAKRQSLAASQNAQVFLRHGKEFSIETLHSCGVKPRRAVEQLRWIGHVRRAAFVDVHRKVRIFAHQGSRGARMIEMNVGQIDGFEVVYREPASAKLLAKRCERRARPGIQHGAVAIRLEKHHGDGARPARPVNVNRRAFVCGHRMKSSVTQRRDCLPRRADLLVAGRA